MPPRNLYHAGGWHLRSTPCVDFFLFRLPASQWHPHISAVFLSVVWLPRCLGCSMLSITVPTRPPRNFLSRDMVLRDFYVTSNFLANLALFHFSFSCLNSRFHTSCPVSTLTEKETLSCSGPRAHQLQVLIAKMVPLFCLFPFVLWFSVPLRFVTLNLTWSFPESALCSVLATRPDIRDTPGHTPT